MSRKTPRTLKSPQTTDDTKQDRTADINGIEAVAPGVHRDTSTGEVVSNRRLSDVE